ncbi:PqqD family protein [Kitasatospora sp. MAP12-44]|uniref:PqqD family protein n=1 Tax=Kitasatospora sp. MAP12-44 TaxID=3035099 RepID=UPI00247621B6|nr:PqqD family protein [Kitasatospora sp. MAP12-44]
MRLQTARKTPVAGAVPAAAEDQSWIETEPLSLRDTVEQLEGADGRPMLFDVATGRYVAISKAGTAILSLLDGEATGRKLIERVIEVAPGDPVRIEEAVARFLGELRDVGVLSAEPPQSNRGKGLRHLSLRRRTPRWPLTRSAHHLLEPLAARLRAIPIRLLLGLWFVSLAVAAGCAGLALSRHPFGMHYSTWFWAAMGIMVVQVAVHETGHALVCQYFGRAGTRGRHHLDALRDAGRLCRPHRRLPGQEPERAGADRPGGPAQ